MSFFRWKRSNKNDERRQQEIDQMYDVNKDVPTTFSNAQGSYRWTGQPGTHSFNFQLDSPLISGNNALQSQLQGQANILAQQGTAALSSNPNASEGYRAYQTQFEDEYNRLRGKQATTMGLRQDNALGRIANNKVMQDLAAYRASMPYQFNQQVINPLLGSTIGNFNRIQQGTNAIQSGILQGFQQGQNAYENNIARRINERDTQQARLNERINSRTSLRDLVSAGAKAFGGVFGDFGGTLAAEPYIGQDPSVRQKQQSAMESRVRSAILAAAAGGAGGASAGGMSGMMTNPAFTGIFSQMFGSQGGSK